MMEKGMKQDFQNTDFASLKALLWVGHTAWETVTQAAWHSYELRNKRKEKQNHPQVCLFSN